MQGRAQVRPELLPQGFLVLLLLGISIGTFPKASQNLAELADCASDKAFRACGMRWSPVEDDSRVHPQSSSSGSSPAQFESADVECVPRIFIEANLGDSYY